MTLFELTQFAFAKGEQTVIGMSQQADAVFKAIDAAFSEEPNQAKSDFWNQLMSRVHYQVELTEEDYLAHNDLMAEQMTGLNSIK